MEGQKKENWLEENRSVHITACLLISVSEHKMNMHVIHSHGGVDWNFHISHDCPILSVGQRWVYTVTYIIFSRHAKLTAFAEIFSISFKEHLGFMWDLVVSNDSLTGDKYLREYFTNIQMMIQVSPELDCAAS